MLHEAGFGGGGIDNDGQYAQLTLDDSQIVGNMATLGGGIYNDGGTISVTNRSVISGNVATWKFNGLSPDGGGGISSRENDDQLTIDNSMIIGNQAPASFGGGIDGWRSNDNHHRICFVRQYSHGRRRSGCCSRASFC